MCRSGAGREGSKIVIHWRDAKKFIAKLKFKQSGQVLVLGIDPSIDQKQYMLNWVGEMKRQPLPH